MKKIFDFFEEFKKAPLQALMHFFIAFLSSLVDFVKASFLSLVIIAIIYLLMTQLEQGLMMIVEMVENDYLALLLSFAYINVLGLMLSHYPIYTYYAGNLGGIHDYYVWQKHPMFGKVLPWLPVYTFVKNPSPGPETQYRVHDYVHWYRYVLGFLIYAAWTQILIDGFSSNIEFNGYNLSSFYLYAHGSSIIPFIVYLIYYQLIKIRKKTGTEGRLLKNLALTYLFFALVGFGLLILLAFLPAFGILGLNVLLILNFVMLLNFVFFRLLRKEFYKAYEHVKEGNVLARLCLQTVRPLARSENYLRFFMYGFILSLAFILYCIFQGMNGGLLMNGFPILLAYLYCYSYIIASLNKYFFVCNRHSSEQVRKDGAHSRLYKITFYGLLILTVSFIFRFSTTTETHQLDQVCWQPALEEETFSEALMDRGDTLFFVASHGGGLKANVWTLTVMHALDSMTHGEFIRQTAAFSGASGGSLGLALYSAISGQCEPDSVIARRKRIDQISGGNYTSIDLTMMLGPDFFRKLFPFNTLGGNHDRAYHSMIRYQNFVDGYDYIYKNELHATPFRNYWQKIYESRKGKFPCLIMNTAATNGQRGIIWSLQSSHFNIVFPNAQNLGDLRAGTRTLNFYQAVSMTNRFPIFSPAAKIEQYGHYVDAGIIDNSGLLGCMDYYNYLYAHSTFGKKMQQKHVVFVEIVNSRSIYVRQFIEDFEAGIKRSLRFKVRESPSILTDVNTIANVDKIADYMGYMIKGKAEREAKFDHIRILLPHRISLKDVEKVLGGELSNQIDKKALDSLKCAIQLHNAKIQKYLEEDPESVHWECLEPELSRQFSPSNLKYVKRILEYPGVKDRLEEISRFAPAKQK
jgi:hypothetical protein